MNDKDADHVVWRRTKNTTTACGNIEVSFLDGHYCLRIAGDPAGAGITLTVAEFDAFAHDMRIGAFDTQMWPTEGVRNGFTRSTTPRPVVPLRPPGPAHPGDEDDA